MFVGIGAGVAGLIMIPVAAVGLFAYSYLIGFSPKTTKSDQPVLAAAASPCSRQKEVAGMVCIDGGEFTMGRDTGANAEEKPAHREKVGAFLIDKYEVTNADYAEFVARAPHTAPKEWRNGEYPKGQDRFPVVGVSWEDAKRLRNLEK